jgi:peptide/nickel transport system ATP-binding protein
VSPHEHLLEVEDLNIEFATRTGTARAVRGVSFAIQQGETLGLVGESGSGKSVTAQSLLGLVSAPGRITKGDIRWKGRSLVHGRAAAAYARSIRGREAAIVVQNAMTSLDPLFKIGTHLTEMLRHNMKVSRQQARGRAVELLDLVGIGAPATRIGQYPAELSGGMQQRVLIAMALACDPELLIADEPTTALDVTVQAQILDHLRDLQADLGIAILLITHDLGVVAGFCDTVAVMYAGKIVEKSRAGELFRDPGHPYTAGLLEAIPRLDQVRDRLVTIGGMAPSLRHVPTGCAFHPRCPAAVDRCRTDVPVLEETRTDRLCACWRAFDHHLTPEGRHG